MSDLKNDPKPSDSAVDQESVLKETPAPEGRPAPLKMDRRSMLTVAAATATAGWATVRYPRPIEFTGPNSSVFVAKAASYSVELASVILRGVRACGLDVRGKRILIKPNVVEFSENTAINTDIAVVAAALEVFQQLGAASVVIGEGPGHRRDTMELAAQARYRQEIPEFDKRFVDLNRDDVSARVGFAPTHQRMYFANTVLGADLIVSLAKMKTHHWAGATLSMKNLFGLIPGSVYGWPKNVLHLYGINESIVELNRLFPNTFAIIDGVVGMEGNGPIQGKPKQAGVIVMGSDVRAVDATCCRIMGINPKLVEYLEFAGLRGHWLEDRIDQRGEAIAGVRTDFEMGPLHGHLRLSEV